MTWSSAAIPSNVDLQIQELDLNIGDPIGLSINMKTANTINFTAGSVIPKTKMFRINATSTSTKDEKSDVKIDNPLSDSSGGITTSEPYANIAKAERYDHNLIANSPITYAFTAPELGVYQIVLTGKENENEIAVRVEALKETSKSISAAAPGLVNKNLNIIVGTKKIKEGIIKFKVENSWLSSNGLDASDIKLVKWEGSKWVQLETVQTLKDGLYAYYEVKVDSFSSFAITALKAGEKLSSATPTASPTATVLKPNITKPETATPTAAVTRKVPGYEIFLAIAGLFAMYLLQRRR